MAKLWDKGKETRKVVERFTVGKDYLYDRRLVPADCLGSIAQARQLERLGIVDTDERDRLEAELRSIAFEAAAGSFSVTPEDEDCHTAIENRLTARIGEAGKRIHAGRSRNDQSATALRLWLREGLLDLISEVLEVASVLTRRAGELRHLPMVGRTHLQPAMLSSVGLWCGAFAEELLDDAELLFLVYDQVDRSPLGAGASYGVPLPLEREYTAALLGFRRVHTNVLASQNGRGKLEALSIDAFDHLMVTLSRFAADIILYSLKEFGYFVLPEDIATGSSIMPQKRNPDVLELIRGKAAAVGGIAQGAKSLLRGLNSGYSRDLQETKAMVIDAFDLTSASLRAAGLVARDFQVDPEALLAPFDHEVLSTDDVFALVEKGAPFRDAYRQVAERLEEIRSGRSVPPAITEEALLGLLRKRTATGSPGNLRLDELTGRIQGLGAAAEEGRQRHDGAVRELLGRPVSLVSEGDPPKDGVEDESSEDE
ncbi:MAG: argininosuccinate lyase [Spirochaetota bacterium]